MSDLATQKLPWHFPVENCKRPRSARVQGFRCGPGASVGLLGLGAASVRQGTIFGGGAHLSCKYDGRLLADMDSNGWLQTGRRKALKEMRRGFAVHVAGDQHLATVIHHGVNAWEDAGYSFCVPSIVNYYARWWAPLKEPGQHDPASPLPYTGRSEPVVFHDSAYSVEVIGKRNSQVIKGLEARPMVSLEREQTAEFACCRLESR